MSANTSNNKRIAKNTLMLYLRMFLILGVTLYTSRVVLKTLGVSDFGVYNIVGGFVSMLAYLNSVFVGSTQRFMSFALGKDDKEKISSTFSTAKLIHILLAIIILVFAETFGLWFINHKLVIDSSRMIAANWVYQCSIASLIITVVSIPYNACIVAHEHMQVYAYVSILDVVLKLIILYILIAIPGDKLIIYALLHVAISLIVRLCYTIYCRQHFEECKVKPAIDKPLFKDMFSYASWVTLGNLGFSFKDQFSNIILNGFFGTTINAARGIAMQVNSAITSFSQNFFMAISPQIVKQYAAGDLEQSQKLVYAGARYSFFLLTLITIPVIVNIEYILNIWLETVPEYTSPFLIITLISSLLYSLTNSTSTAIQATGNIRAFQIGVSIIMLLELPAAYFILKAGYKPPYALIPMIFTTILALIYRFYVLKKLIPTYSMRKYYINTVLKCVLLFFVCFIPILLLKIIIPIGFSGFCVSIFCSILLTSIVIYYFGINSNERFMLKHYIILKLNIINRHRY